MYSYITMHSAKKNIKFYTTCFNTKKIPCTFAIALSNTKHIEVIYNNKPRCKPTSDCLRYQTERAYGTSVK